MPIPGTTKLHRLHENVDAVGVELTPADLKDLAAASDQVDVHAARYPEHMQRWIDR